MKFKDFFDNDDPIIAKMAAFLAEAEEGAKNGVLTQEQFHQLVEDAEQVEQMDELANDLERKIAVQNTIKIFKTIAGIIKVK